MGTEGLAVRERRTGIEFNASRKEQALHLVDSTTPPPLCTVLITIVSTTYKSGSVGDHDIVAWLNSIEMRSYIYVLRGPPTWAEKVIY